MVTNEDLKNLSAEDKAFMAGYAACAYEITKEWNGESDGSDE